MLVMNDKMASESIADGFFFTFSSNFDFLYESVHKEERSINAIIAKDRITTKIAVHMMMLVVRPEFLLNSSFKESSL